jgi:hypothetical protein
MAMAQWGANSNKGKATNRRHCNQARRWQRLRRLPPPFWALVEMVMAIIIRMEGNTIRVVVGAPPLLHPFPAQSAVAEEEEEAAEEETMDLKQKKMTPPNPCHQMGTMPTANTGGTGELAIQHTILIVDIFKFILFAIKKEYFYQF